MSLSKTERKIKKRLETQTKETKDQFETLFADVLRSTQNQRTTRAWLVNLELDRQFGVQTKDPVRDRLVKYTFEKFFAVLNKLQSSASNKVSLVRTTQINPDGKIKKIKSAYSEAYKKMNVTEPRSYEFADVVRRLRDGMELTPLNITFLDPELFTACFVMTEEKAALDPSEQKCLIERILSDFVEYVRGKKEYHDLSTLWWALKILVEQKHMLKAQRKLKLVGELLTLPGVRTLVRQRNEVPERKWDELIKETLITKDGNRKKAFERLGSFVSEMRSLVYCHGNAVEIRKWVRNLRDPQQLALINMIREFEDSCGNIGLRWCAHGHRKWLYDAALRLEFLNSYWDNRVGAFETAMQIIDGGGIFKNRSRLKGYVTSNTAYSRKIGDVASAVEQHVANVGKQPVKRPLVVGLFGNPGSGKSYLAKKICRGELITINLSIIANERQFFSQVVTKFAGSTMLSQETGLPVTTNESEKGGISPPRYLLLDEFDVRRADGFWFRWLLTLLWDLKIPQPKTETWDVTNINVDVIFLAASRFERFQDFRDFCISPPGKEQKATDLLSRIDCSVDIPDLTPADRCLILNALTQEKASNVLRALFFLSEIEDGARGIEKLMKGVDLTKAVNLEKLNNPAKEDLLKSAGILDRSLSKLIV